MKVIGLVWLGVATDRYEQTVDFFHHVLGLDIAFREDTTIEFATENGDRVQIFSPDDRYYDFFGGQGAAVVPLFEVDSLGDARVQLDGSGVTIVGAEETDATWKWIHVRGPDGNTFALAERRH